MSHPC